MGRCRLEGQAGKGQICVSPGAVSCIRGWAVVGVDPVAVGVTLFAEWIFGVLYADPATVRCGQDCALHNTRTVDPQLLQSRCPYLSIFSNAVYTRRVAQSCRVQAA